MISLSDVWLFDTESAECAWTQIKPEGMKLENGQTVEFTPRMAHTTCVWQSYLITFGGFCSQDDVFMPSYIAALKLQNDERPPPVEKTKASPVRDLVINGASQQEQQAKHASQVK